MAPGSRILALGHYQPARVLGNDELATMVDTSDEWIRERVGIATRRVAARDETVADMAAAAAGKTLARSGLDPADVDMVVVATATGLCRMPNTAAQVARELGVRGAAALDVNTACSGFPAALATADHAIRAGAATSAIVVGVDKMSDFTDYADRTTCVLFGDGAGAAVITAAASPAQGGIGPVVWGSDADLGDAISLTTDDPDGDRPLFRQQGQAVYRWATGLAPLALSACERAGVDPADLDGIVTHQANLRIIDVLARKIGAPNAVVATDVVESGNTSAAGVPIALAKMAERGRLARGSAVLLFGFGAGLIWAGQVIRCP